MMDSLTVQPYRIENIFIFHNKYFLQIVRCTNLKGNTSRCRHFKNAEEASHRAQEGAFFWPNTNAIVGQVDLSELHRVIFSFLSEDGRTPWRPLEPA